MNRPVTIVVLARYWEIFAGFLDSAEEFAPEVPKILVRDPTDEAWPHLHGRWQTIAGPETFSMAANANLGVKAAAEFTGKDSDILYCGDDIRFLEAQTVERLQAIAYAHPEVGILSPRLEGRASFPLAHPQSECDYVRPIEMWFPCVYLKRELIGKVGDWDERFDSFGDDFDYSVRAELAGYRCAVTNAVTVRHDGAPSGGGGVSGGPSTFVKRAGPAGWKKPGGVLETFAAKYGVTLERLHEYIRTGELPSS